MMKFYLTLLVFFTLVSCSDEPQPESGIVGLWELNAVLADPGDGSGVFQAVDSDRTITFYETGTFLSSGELCSLNPQSSNESRGTYDTAMMVLIPNECMINDTQISLTYNLTNQEELIVNLLCIEPCALKYHKVYSQDFE